MRDLKNKSTFLSVKCKPVPAHCMSSPHSIAPVGPWDGSQNLKSGKNVNREQNTHKNHRLPAPHLQNTHKNETNGLHHKTTLFCFFLVECSEPQDSIKWATSTHLPWRTASRSYHLFLLKKLQGASEPHAVASRTIH
uniref:Uncharacterized protein n=1 Tax=Triticum urartu TaxID=4572 RepID=A0A8R7UH62_TRIUA